MAGSLGMLGHWDPMRAVPLKTTKDTYPVWTIKLDLPRDKIIEYKFLIIKAPGLKKSTDIKGNITWEILPPGINRLISTHGKKELVISEEINNTQSVEEYVEIITAIPHTNPNFEGDTQFYANPLNQHQSIDSLHIFKEDELDNADDRCNLKRPKINMDEVKSRINEESDEDFGYRESDEEEEPMVDTIQAN
jgi:hypothetical protein